VTNQDRQSSCPDAETLAAFAEGRLDAGTRREVIAHVESCDDCVSMLEILSDTIATRPATSARSRVWLIAAAAAVVAAIAAITAGVFRDRRATPMARLIELAPRDARPVEARLSGGFPWAAYRGPMRAEDASADPKQMQLVGMAGELVAKANRDRDAASQHAAGMALLVIDQPLAAVDRLRSAAQSSPNDAAAWSDLAAAQYAAALRLARPSLLPEGLASADRALKIDPRHAEGRFNRALLLERLGLTREARVAWQRYLEVDPSSPWAVEARQRIAKIDAMPSGAQFRRDLPRIESAAASGDAATLATLIGAHAQMSRAYAEVEILNRWAASKNDADLNVARAIGDALVKKSGESLLREAVRAIDASGPALAEAHAIYRRGRFAYSRRELAPALADLDRAAAEFSKRRSPMALVARYYAACVRFDQNDVAAARAALEGLLAEASLHPEFAALGAQIRWELALCRMVDGDWSGALPLLDESRSSFRRLDERYHLGFIESLLADTLLSLGRRDEGWAARTRAFAILSADDDPDRLPVSMKAAAQMEMRAGLLENARALLDAARASVTGNASDAIAADVLVHASLVSVALGDRDEAARTLRDASAAAERIADPAARELAKTHLDLAGAAAVLKGDPRHARAMLTRAIDAYRASGRTVFLPECYLLRARASDRADAIADLDAGIEALEHSRIRTGTIVGTGVLNAGVALYEDAIRLAAENSDVERALRYAERSRAQVAGATTSLRDVQAQLGDAAVLDVITLPDEIVTLCITARDAAMQRHRGREVTYDVVVRPFEAQIANARQLIVVADRATQSISFAALYDGATKRRLIERMPVSMAISAGALRRAHRPAAGSLLAVALPSGSANAGLPETAGEIAGITTLYRNAVTIAPDRATFAEFESEAPRADVIHIAGHTLSQSDDDGTALVFAKERVTWTSIATRPLPRAPIVVLAACNTLRQPLSPNVRAMTLGEGFLAAGATDVIGTLAPIPDVEARPLFESIHRHLAAGASPAEAVRAAQLEAISRGDDVWRAVTSLTRSTS